MSAYVLETVFGKGAMRMLHHVEIDEFLETMTPLVTLRKLIEKTLQIVL